MTVPVIPNLRSPVAAVLTNPTTGKFYGNTSSGVASTKTANGTSPVGVVLINPISGAAYTA